MAKRKFAATSSRPTLRNRRAAKRRRMTSTAVRKIVQRTVAGSEPKLLIITSPLGSGGTTYSNTSDINYSLVQIPQGDTSGSRIGLKARITGIHLKLRMHLDAQAGNTVPMFVRIRMDEVKTGVVSATTGISALDYFSRPDYVDVTKKALFDKIFLIRAGGDGDCQGPTVLFNKMFRFKDHWCRWETGAAAEPSTGNIVIAAYVQSQDGSATQTMTLLSNARTYFSEV